MSVSAALPISTSYTSLDDAIQSLEVLEQL